MTWLHGRVAALTLSALLLGSGAVRAEEKLAVPDRKPAKEAISFGVLESQNVEATRARAFEWLKETGKADANQKAFDTIWASDSALIDKVADTFCLVDPGAATLMTDARDPMKAAPTSVPALFKDLTKPAFYRANLAVAYARALANRRIYEEGLEALRTVKAEQVVDPATYLFQRAVAEHALLLKDDANRSILRLLDDVVDAPERYKMVAALMHFDMLSWREKDLGWVARMMNNIERRLDLSRGGPKTQDMQKKVVLQLDEMIKQMEDQQCNCNNPGNGNNGRPNGNTLRSSRPAQDDYLGGIGGPGKVDPKKFKEIAEVWGKMPEKERAKAMLELTRDMPVRHRELIENYFKNLARSETTPK